HLHGDLPGDRSLYLGLLGDQVPGGHGLDADIHVPLEHGGRDLAAAGPGPLPDQAGETDRQGWGAAAGELKRYKVARGFEARIGRCGPFFIRSWMLAGGVVKPIAE